MKVRRGGKKATQKIRNMQSKGDTWNFEGVAAQFPRYSVENIPDTPPVHDYFELVKKNTIFLNPPPH
jgi:hypothetical protein